jgi:hypothetical protein
LSSATPAAAPPRNAGQFLALASAGSIKAAAITKNCVMHEPF